MMHYFLVLCLLLCSACSDVIANHPWVVAERMQNASYENVKALSEQAKELTVQTKELSQLQIELLKLRLEAEKKKLEAQRRKQQQ